MNYINKHKYIVAYNIRSINKNFEDLCIHIDNINIKFDMIVLTEAWIGLKDIDFNRFQIPSYSNYFTSRPKNQNDGVFIFIKYDIKNIQVTDLNLSSISCLEISILIDVGKLTIYAIYRSPNDNIDDYLTELENDIFTRTINQHFLDSNNFIQYLEIN